MNTECSTDQLAFHALGPAAMCREVEPQAGFVPYLLLLLRDLNPHDESVSCGVSVLAMLSGCTDLGAGRVRPSDRGKPLAGKSTLNRLELTPEEGGADERYKKTVADFSAMDACLPALPVPSP